MRGWLNPRATRDDHVRGLFRTEEYRDVHTYFGAHPELSPTPLRLLPALAEALGLGALMVKDESARFGVNAFKIVGVRYAVGSDLDLRFAGRHSQSSRETACDRKSRSDPELVCASTGNHGRAVARVAHDKGLQCAVFVPAARGVGAGAHDAEVRIRAERVAAMQADGARVIEINGSYDDAVRAAAAYGSATGAAIVSDTSWPGYDEIPRAIMAGYTQILEEAYGQWDRVPDVIAVQAGVGGLVCAVVSWCAWRFGARRPFVIACEPDAAACLLASAEAGRPIALDGDLPTSMAGLRCAQPSLAAWPTIAAGVDAFVSIPDALAIDMMRRLDAPARGDPRVRAGLSGACGAAGLAAVAQDTQLADVRAAAGMDRSTHALVIVTEGP